MAEAQTADLPQSRAHQRIYPPIRSSGPKSRPAARSTSSCAAAARTITNAPTNWPDAGSSPAASTSIKDLPLSISARASVTVRSTPLSVPPAKVRYSACWKASPRYTVLHKLDSATADLTNCAIIIKLRPHRARVHTIKADNGKEFAGHQRAARCLDAQFYFAKPSHAWECGLNETPTAWCGNIPQRYELRRHHPGRCRQSAEKTQLASTQGLGIQDPKRGLLRSGRRARRGYRICISELNPRAQSRQSRQLNNRELSKLIYVCFNPFFPS